MLIVVYLILIRQSPHFEKYSNSAVLVIIALLASIATEICSLILIDKKQEDYKRGMTMLNCLFLVDFVLIGFMTYAILIFRKVEVQIMFAIGIFKDMKDMNDQELFQEYDKMRKQSHRVKEKYKKYRMKKRMMEDATEERRHTINEDDDYNKANMDETAEM